MNGFKTTLEEIQRDASELGPKLTSTIEKRMDGLVGSVRRRIVIATAFSIALVFLSVWVGITYEPTCGNPVVVAPVLCGLIVALMASLKALVEDSARAKFLKVFVQDASEAEARELLKTSLKL